jgi:predicted nucleic acid-binding protein
MERAFFDTNILFYAHDARALDKQAVAQDLLLRHSPDPPGTATGVVSTQVLQEFFINATKKLGLPPMEARELVAEYDTAPARSDRLHGVARVNSRRKDGWAAKSNCSSVRW